MVTLEEIYTRYPHPVSLQRHFSPPEGSYCVGGALCLSLGEEFPYPSVDTLCKVVEPLNPALSYAQRFFYACKLIDANEREDFPTAWSVLATLLSSSPGA